MKIFISSISLILLFFCCSNKSQAQLVINEYSCSNISTLQDNFNNYEDWIELYNKGNAAVSLAGYYLSDDKNLLLKWAIPSGTIAAHGYKIIYASGLDTVVGNNLHTNFKLTQTKNEPIILSSPSGAFIDSVVTRPAQADHSRGRTTDGATTWSVFTSPSNNTSNLGDSPEYTTIPVFSVSAGSYATAQTISITCSSPNTTIYYTTNGRTPDASSTQYTTPVSIAATTVLRAIAIDDNGIAPPSFVESNTYFINAPHAIAIISIYGDNVATLMNGTEIDPVTSLEYFDKNGIFKSEATGTSNKHGNDSWAYDQRGIDFIARDQYGYSNAIKQKLFDNKTRKSFQKIILKAAANDNYTAEDDGAHIRDAYVNTLAQKGNMNLDARTYDPCVIYVNGKYWGVYEIREKVDDSDFTDYYYHQNEPNIQFIKTWGATWSEYGGNKSLTDWQTFRNFVNANNMAIPANYNYVDSVYNVKSLTDYFILNSYVVCTDWLNWNTAWWRGLDPNGNSKKWRYALWDEDATFGHYINYTNVPNQTPSADPCNAENLPNPGGQGHTQIMKKLLNNPDFEQYYVSRYIDLTNSTLNCTFMQNLLDSLIGLIKPEMPAQIARWPNPGASYNKWLSNVQELKTFIADRCTDVQSGMNTCYALNGPYDFCVDIEPAEAGTSVKLNSLTLNQFPWTGKYYGGIKTFLTASSNSKYLFDHWEINTTDSIHSSSKDSVIYVNITKNNCLKAVYIEQVKPELVSIMPNVFSPNGDGSNDLFIPISPIQDFNAPVELSVFNRWGKLIFKSDDLKTGWDGKNNGRECEAGSYYWLVRYHDASGDTKDDKGFVTLVK